MKIFSLKVITAVVLISFSHGVMSDVLVNRNPKTLTATVSIEKRINHKDWQALQDALQQIDEEGYKLKLNAVVLNSKGGGPTSAMAIGKIIREKRLNTYVASNAECSSACIYVLSGGVIRMAYGVIQVHRTKYFEELPIEELDAKLIETDKKTRDYIEYMGLSLLLTEAILMTPQWAVRELTKREKENWGVHAIERLHEGKWFRATAMKHQTTMDAVTDTLIDNYENCERMAKRFEMTLLDCVENSLEKRKNH